MRAKLENIEGIEYLLFTPEGMEYPTRIPVITKGDRDKKNSWTWNGSLEKPTIRPSVRTGYINDIGEPVEIHYWLNDGVCACLHDCTDGNSGKKLNLLENY